MQTLLYYSIGALLECDVMYVMQGPAICPNNSVTIYGRGFGFILIILLLVGFYIQKSYVRFSYTFDRLDF